MGGCICSSFDWNGDFSAIIKGSRKTAFFTLKILICCDILSFDKNRGRKLFMKKIICIIETVLAILMIAVLIFGIKNDIAPQNVFNETVLKPEGTWSEKMLASDEIVQYEYDVPKSQNEKKWIMMLKTHWVDFEIFADDVSLYRTEGKRTGFVHLFEVPTEKKLTVQFFHVSEKAADAIEQSDFQIGNRSGIYRMILVKNIHAGIFAVFAAVSGFTAIFAGFYMRKAWTRQICESLICLGAFVVDAGSWILTDSKFLLLFTQKSGVIELVSFFAFFMLAIPLLGFTKRMFTGKEKMFGIMQCLFAAMLGLYCINYITAFIPLAIIIVLEHILIAITITIVVVEGFIRLHKNKNVKLFRVLSGYSIFSICSIIAIVFYYIGLEFQYSISYVIAILCFAFFLADAAGIAIYEQIRENANVALYAKMAYTDMMTGLKNRAAFIDDSNRDAHTPGAVSYIMIDANNLKKVNDSLGHKRGDELLTTVARCMEAGVKKYAGNGRCYRIGGDEFVIRLNNATEQDTKECMQRVKEALAAADKKTDIPISAAMGYAWSDAPDKDTEKLLQNADAQMYENKQMMKKGKIL